MLDHRFLCPHRISLFFFFPQLCVQCISSSLILCPACSFPLLGIELGAFFGGVGKKLAAVAGLNSKGQLW